MCGADAEPANANGEKSIPTRVYKTDFVSKTTIRESFLHPRNALCACLNIAKIMKITSNLNDGTEEDELKIRAVILSS